MDILGWFDHVSACTKNASTTPLVINRFFAFLESASEIWTPQILNHCNQVGQNTHLSVPYFSLREYSNIALIHYLSQIMLSRSGTWENSIFKLKDGLVKSKFDVNRDMNNYEAFQKSLEYVLAKYSRKNVVKIVNDRLYPHFDHVRSFEKAVTTAAQGNTVTSLVWSASLAVIEVSLPLILLQVKYHKY